MSKVKIMLFAATLGSGAPRQACNLDGGFGMHRFNPFGAAHSNAGSGSWNDSLISNRKGYRQQEAPVADAELAERTILQKLDVRDNEPVSKPLKTDRRDKQRANDLGNRGGGTERRVMSRATDLQTERAVVD